MGSLKTANVMPQKRGNTPGVVKMYEPFSPKNQVSAAALALERSLLKPWYEGYVEKRWLSLDTYYKLKRISDLACCIIALPVLLPVLLLCYIAIKLDSPGTVFFFQERTGKGGQRFKMYKLRTMVVNAEELKQKYMHLNELTYPDFKITKDPRITRVGRFLRKTSLDELPQVLNVLIGDMSLVGPRPTSFSANTYRLWHTARLEVKPGMTGLWQVSGRNELDFDDRLRLDIAYLRNQCFMLDLRVMLLTIGTMFHGRGAN